MNSKVVGAAAALAVVSIFIAFRFNPFFDPLSIPGSKDILHTAQILQVTGAVGPESLVFDQNGEGPYTGVADGRILKWEGEGRGWKDFAVTTSNRTDCTRPFAPEFEHVCGRPLGLRFDKKTGDLYIADAYLGLQIVGPRGGLASQVVTEVEGKPLRFTNDMDISEDDNVIYFTDSSTNYQRRQFMLALLTGDHTGRLVKYDMSTKKVRVLLHGLAFSNGVALSKDGSFVLVAETTTCRIQRLWLRGPNAGQVDTFAELPGFPDNIRRNSKGEFWVALHAKKSPSAKWLASNLWARQLILKLQFSFKQLHASFAGRKPHGSAIKLSDRGEILEVLEDCEGRALRFISEVEERDGKLWIASVLTPFIGIYRMQQSS